MGMDHIELPTGGADALGMRAGFSLMSANRNTL